MWHVKYQEELFYNHLGRCIQTKHHCSVICARYVTSLFQCYTKTGFASALVKAFVDKATCDSLTLNPFSK